MLLASMLLHGGLLLIPSLQPEPELVQGLAMRSLLNADSQNDAQAMILIPAPSMLPEPSPEPVTEPPAAPPETMAIVDVPASPPMVAPPPLPTPEPIAQTEAPAPAEALSEELLVEDVEETVEEIIPEVEEEAEEEAIAPEPAPEPELPAEETPDEISPDPLAAINHPQGAAGGCFGQSSCFELQQTGIRYRNLGEQVAEELMRQGYEVSLAPNYEEAGRTVYEVVLESDRWYLTVLSTGLETAVYVLAEEPMTLADLEANPEASIPPSIAPSDVL